MQCRASRKHEKTFQELKAQAEGDKRNIVHFPSVERQPCLRMNYSGLKRMRFRQVSHWRVNLN